jgi:hypothetical protein
MLNAKGPKPSKSNQFIYAIAVIAALGTVFAAWSTPIRAENTVQPSHTYAFGKNATFTLQSVSTSETVEATLFLDINGKDLEGYEGVVNGSAFEYQRDLATSPFAPFAEITYWWQIQSDKSDSPARKTDPITFRYIDNRYTWQSLNRGSLTVHWISGGAEVMASALDVGTQALADLNYALHPRKPRDLHIYIYPSHSELQSAMQLAGHTWAEGITYPALSVILIAIPATDGAIVRMKRTIPHELTHQVLYNRMGAQGYQNLPTWLNEGLATNFEQSPNATYALTLEESHDRFPLESLCAPFPDDERVRLAYAQSQSVVSYLREIYGWSAIRELLDVYADGVGCETGVVRILNADLDHLDHQWSRWLKGDAPSIEPNPPAWKVVWNRIQIWTELAIETAGPWLVFVGFILIPGALSLVLSRRER